ncbi:MAG: GNAT family N-acetyltransferase [Kineosporiaceae bacterium]
MTVRHDVRLAPLTRADADAVVELDQWAFAYDEADLDPGPALDALEWDRITGAWLPGPDGVEVLAGMCGVYTLRMALPHVGTPLPLQRVAGLTWVGVHPQHRRRGVMTALLHDHLRGVAAAGVEPLSVLFAAEPAIYGRFGYGLATQALTMTLPRGAALRAVPGTDGVTITYERIDIARHADLLADLLERAAPARAGTMARDSVGLRRYAWEDQPRLRRGRESLRVALAHRDGGLVGYAVFARETTWGAGGPEGTVHVRELLGLDAAAEAALWGRLADLDLTTTVDTGRRPVDDRLLHLLLDSRAARPALVDCQFVRVVDLPAALALRRYSCPVDVVLEVRDELLPANAGRWRLVGGPDGAACTPTGDEAGVVLDVRELGAAYLGGTSLAALAAAGLVTGDPHAIAGASAAFTTTLAPAGTWIF